VGRLAQWRIHWLQKPTQQTQLITATSRCRNGIDKRHTGGYIIIMSEKALFIKEQTMYKIDSIDKLELYQTSTDKRVSATSLGITSLQDYEDKYDDLFDEGWSVYFDVNFWHESKETDKFIDPDNYDEVRRFDREDFGF